MKPMPRIKLHKTAILYGALLLFALLFTQALRAPASALLFWFLLLMPVGSLLYSLIGRAALRIYVEAPADTVQKHEPVTVTVRIINQTPLPFPFLEAWLMLPRDDGVRCEGRSVQLTLSPFGSAEITRETAFRYRGTYQVGLSGLYIADVLHLFSLRTEEEILENILVMPRKLYLEGETGASATDIPNDTHKTVSSGEKSEVTNIRTYRPGDSLKSIHWKLSSKTEESLMVKEYNTNLSKNVTVLCDFARRVPVDVLCAEGTDPMNAGGTVAERYREDMDEYAVDGVVEIASAAVYSELAAGSTVTLLWRDSRQDGGIGMVQLESREQFDEIYRVFVTAPVCSCREDAVSLLACVEESMNVTIRLCTANLDPIALDEYAGIPVLFGGAGTGCETEILLFNPTERYEDEKQRREYTDLAETRLANAGVILRDIRGAEKGEMVLRF